MIIVIDENGQLGNRLSLFGHLIGFSAEHKVRIINFAFASYRDLFESTQGQYPCCYPKSGLSIPFATLSKRIVRAFFSRLLKLSSRLPKNPLVDLIEAYDSQSHFVLSSPENLARIRSRKLTFIRGYFFRDKVNVGKNAEIIREYFKPQEKFQINIKRSTSKAKENSDLLIGVHIRQGDYKTYRGGEYFLESEEYLKVMKTMKVLFENQKIAFLICSDTSQKQELFADMNCHYGSGDLLEDLYSLAECDYLLGAPSSFSRWASFYGEVPLYVLKNSSKLPALEDFKINHELWG